MTRVCHSGRTRESCRSLRSRHFGHRSETVDNELTLRQTGVCKNSERDSHNGIKTVVSCTDPPVTDTRSPDWVRGHTTGSCTGRSRQDSSHGVAREPSDDISSVTTQL